MACPKENLDPPAIAAARTNNDARWQQRPGSSPPQAHAAANWGGVDRHSGANGQLRPRPQSLPLIIAFQVNDMIYYKKRDGRFTFEDFRSVLRFK